MNTSQTVYLRQTEYVVPPVVHAVQGDTGRQLKMIIADRTVPADTTAELAFIRSDKSHYAISCGTVDAADNSFTASDITQALTQAGACHCQLKVDGIVSTFTFIIDVQPDTTGISQQQDGYSVDEIIDMIDGKLDKPSDAAFHNAVYRGKYLGTNVTQEQYDAIANGTFDDLYLGDYWTINSINWRIWGFDWLYQRGRTPSGSQDRRVLTHHVVLMPDECLIKPNGESSYMNDTNDTSTGFAGSKMFTDVIPNTVVPAIQAIFGSSHIVNMPFQASNAATDGVVTSSGAGSIGAMIPTVFMITGVTTTNSFYEELYGTVFPLVQFAPQYIYAGEYYWLRNIVSGTHYLAINDGGTATRQQATAIPIGIRPFFLLGTNPT